MSLSGMGSAGSIGASLDLSGLSASLLTLGRRDLSCLRGISYSHHTLANAARLSLPEVELPKICLIPFHHFLVSVDLSSSILV